MEGAKAKEDTFAKPLRNPAGEDRLRRAVVDVGVTVDALREGGRGSGVNLEGGEGQRAALLDESTAGTSGEGRWLLDGGDGHRDGLGAVNELPRVVADDCELGHTLRDKRSISVKRK